MGGGFDLRVDRHERAAMTGRAITSGQRAKCGGMAHNSRFESGIIIVAGVAGRCGWNMQNIFTGRGNTIVASGTTTRYHAPMGKSSRLPCRRAMASIAGLAGRQVGGGFDLGIDSNIGSAMTCGAITSRHGPRCCRVIHDARCKGGECFVAAIALRRGRNVISRLAECNTAVMAA